MCGNRSARAWALDLGLALVAVLLGLFFRHEALAEGESVPPAVDVVSGAAAFLGLVLFRRSHPVALTAVLIPVGAVLPVPMGATPVALFAVALHRPARIAVALTAVHAAGVIVLYRIAVPSTTLYLEAVLSLVLLHVAMVTTAMLVRAQRMLVRSWTERARQAEESQRLRVEQGRLAERERIAREMHDVLAHRLSLLAVHAGALEVRRAASADERDAAGVIRRCAHEALEDLRQVIGTLRDAPDADPPGATLDGPAPAGRGSAPGRR